MNSTPSNVIDPAFFNQVAQIAHFFTMLALTLVFALFFPHLWWLGFVLCLVYAGVHEFFWDPKEENAATRGSDLQDFCFLALGSGVGVVLFIYFASHFHISF